MLNADVMVGKYRVCCDHCGMSVRIPRMAEELKRFIDAYRYGDWIGNVAGGFDFNEMMKGWSGSRVRAAGAAWKAAACLNAM